MHYLFPLWRKRIWCVHEQTAASPERNAQKIKKRKEKKQKKKEKKFSWKVKKDRKKKATISLRGVRECG